MALSQITNSRAAERVALVRLLCDIPPGATVTYGELDRAGGLSVRDARHVLASARAELRDESGVVFEPIPNVGLRRLTDDERATVAPDRRRRKAYRQATTGLKEMRGLESASLAPGERQQFLGRLALLSAVAAVATHRALTRVLAVDNPDGPNLPLDKTLDLLKDIR